MNTMIAFLSFPLLQFFPHQQIRAKNAIDEIFVQPQRVDEQAVDATSETRLRVFPSLA
jgi:hypothetical protein